MSSSTVLMCKCRRRGPAHAWEPGESCPPQRVPVPGEDCARCEGGGSYSELGECTTYDQDCGCSQWVVVDPCPDCGGDGVVRGPLLDNPNTEETR